MASVDNLCSEKCAFCSLTCIGTFRHILVVAEENEKLLKKVLLELKSPTTPPDSSSYRTCDDCRQKIITSYNIPESCFKVMHSTGEVDIKVEPELQLDGEASHSEGKANKPAAAEPMVRINAEHGKLIDSGGEDAPQEQSDEVADGEQEASGADAPKKKGRSTQIRYRCQYCGKGFVHKSILDNHVRWHTGEKPYKCDHCGKGFSENSKLKLHVRTHTGERPYACPNCPKTFIHSGALKIHIRTHTKEAPHVCEFCDRRFTQSYNLTVHLRNEHKQVTLYKGREVGIEPEFKCEICGKISRDRTLLRLHMRLHESKKLFSCATCGKEYNFVHKCKLVRQKEDDKEILCKICGKKFNHKQNVVYHMNRMHNQFGDAAGSTAEPVVQVKEEVAS